MNEQQTEQMSAFSIPTLPALVHVGQGGGASVEVRFAAFHEANPQVYESLRTLALQLKSRGQRTFGIKALFEYLRFSYALQTTGDSYKINNSYAPLYARLLIEREPQLAGFFQLRTRWGRQ